MAIVEVAILYAACGVGFAAAVLVRKPRTLGDALLVSLLWPLFGPFLFLREPPAAKGLVELLPTPEAIAPLRARLAQAEARRAEIDALLVKPAFDIKALEERLASLEATSATPLALASARSRKKSIERLALRRKVLAAELEELAELFLQLETQTEVIRLAGDVDDSVCDLVADIQSRLESIDEIAFEGVWGERGSRSNEIEYETNLLRSETK